jgi:hypothetical protein
LQSHDNNEVYENAVKILKTYYLVEDTSRQWTTKRRRDL